MSTRPRQPRKTAPPKPAADASTAPAPATPPPAPFAAPAAAAAIDGARYITDIVPDGSSFPCDQAFHDTWSMRNTGNTTWGPGYELALAGGDALGAPASVPLPPAKPGETVDVTVNFQTPPRPGRFRSVWRSRNPAGALFGDPVWVDIIAVQREHLPQNGQASVRDKMGIDANAPTDSNSGSISPRVADPGIISSIGPGWVRINFILRPWQNPLDTAQHSGKTWEQTYRSIIDGLRSKGMRIYGLVSHESVFDGPGSQFRDAPPAGQVPNDWIRNYVENLHTIVRQFQDSVEAFESFNEPDNWTWLGPWDTNNQRNWVHPGWFAIMLQEIAQRIRSDPQTAGARLVSGPLQGMDTGNSARGYMQQAYAAGKARYGWGQRVPYPFDAIGYHLYIAQNPPNPGVDIPAKYNQFMSELRQVITDAEGRLRPIVVSEMGWPNAAGEDRQAECIRIGMRCLMDDPNVALGIFFCTQDWDNLTWGLYRTSGLSPSDRKPAYAALQKLCADTTPVPVATWPAPVAPAVQGFAGVPMAPGMAPMAPIPPGLAPMPMAAAAAMPAASPAAGELAGFWRQHLEQALGKNQELFDELSGRIRSTLGGQGEGAAPEGLETAAALGVILNTYWARLAHATDPATVHQDLDDITRATLAQLRQLAAARRPDSTQP